MKFCKDNGYDYVTFTSVQPIDAWNLMKLSVENGIRSRFIHQIKNLHQNLNPIDLLIHFEMHNFNEVNFSEKEKKSLPNLISKKSYSFNFNL